MTDPLEAAAEALSKLPYAKSMSLRRRREIAETVLDALRTPTPEAVAAGTDAYAVQTYTAFTTEDAAAVAIWQAMWDAGRIQPAYRPTSIDDLGKDDGEDPLPVYGAPQ